MAHKIDVNIYPMNQLYALSCDVAICHTQRHRHHGKSKWISCQKKSFNLIIKYSSLKFKMYNNPITFRILEFINKIILGGVGVGLDRL